MPYHGLEQSSLSLHDSKHKQLHDRVDILAQARGLTYRMQQSADYASVIQLAKAFRVSR